VCKGGCCLREGIYGEFEAVEVGQCVCCEGLGVLDGVGRMETKVMRGMRSFGVFG